MKKKLSRSGWIELFFLRRRRGRSQWDIPETLWSDKNATILKIIWTKKPLMDHTILVWRRQKRKKITCSVNSLDRHITTVNPLNLRFLVQGILRELGIRKLQIWVSQLQLLIREIITSSSQFTVSLLGNTMNWEGCF